MSLLNDIKEGITRLAIKAALVFILTFGAVLIVVAALAAAGDPGCVQADEFDVESSIVDSYPAADGVTGSYDAIDGGQRAEWHDTGYISNGEQFIIEVGGSWTPWNRASMSDAKLAALKECNFCAKKLNAVNDNCICYPGQQPESELNIAQRKISNDPNYCSSSPNYNNQNDPTRCTCSADPSNGTVFDYATYHFPLDTLNKDETSKIADRQEYCKYNKGMGLYIALFGSKGVEVPVRAYHLFSTEEACEVARNSDNKCVDLNGNDITRYVFRSANNRIFMKDDHAGNTGVDFDTSDDEYHKPNEAVKIIIYDRYYADNYGQYTVYFLKGIGKAGDIGLIEYVVRMIEDALLGELKDGVRSGGVIQYMFKSLVQDSIFINLVQFSLSFYIIFFGMAVLMGMSEITKKELMSRVLKVGLIIFFTNPYSWSWYNHFVVAFFKDGMDSVVAMMMDLSDRSSDTNTTMTLTEQANRASSVNNATRFSYVDLIIKKLFSLAVSKKIFSLIFSTGFGLIYIVVIYALIGFFLYVMMLAAVTYSINLIKLIFVLALGPIFICFSLFSHTSDMFKNWLSFLGTRSLEIIMVFTVLYYFIIMIDQTFTSLLSYRTCIESYNVGLFSVKILKSTVSSSFIGWMTSFIKIAGLTFMMKLIFSKLPSICSALISVDKVKSGGDSAAGGLGSTMSRAGQIMDSAMSVGKDALSFGKNVAGTAGRYALQGATSLARSSGLAKKWNDLSEKIPIRGLRRRFVDSKVDSAISAAKKANPNASASQIRKAAMKSIMEDIRKNPNDSALMGLTVDSALRRMDEKLIKGELQNKAKEFAKELKKLPANKIPIGQAMKDRVAEQLKEWVAKEAANPKKMDEFLKDSDVFGTTSRLNDAVNKSAFLDTDEAAKLFARDNAKKNEYLNYLKNRQFENSVNAQQSTKKGVGHALGYAAERAKAFFTRSAEANPNMAEENFLRRVTKEEQGVRWYNAANSRLSSVGEKEANIGAVRANERSAMNAKEQGETAFFMDRFKNGVTKEAQEAINEMQSGKSNKQQTVDKLNALSPGLGNKSDKVLDKLGQAKGKKSVNGEEAAKAIADIAAAELAKRIMADRVKNSVNELKNGKDPADSKKDQDQRDKERMEQLKKASDNIANAAAELGLNPSKFKAGFDAQMSLQESKANLDREIVRHSAENKALTEAAAAKLAETLKLAESAKREEAEKEKDSISKERDAAIAAAKAKSASEAEIKAITEAYEAKLAEAQARLAENLKELEAEKERLAAENKKALDKQLADEKEKHDRLAEAARKDISEKEEALRTQGVKVSVDPATLAENHAAELKNLTDSADRKLEESKNPALSEADRSRLKDESDKERANIDAAKSRQELEMKEALGKAEVASLIEEGRNALSAAKERQAAELKNAEEAEISKMKAAHEAEINKIAKEAAAKAEAAEKLRYEAEVQLISATAKSEALLAQSLEEARRKHAEESRNIKENILVPEGLAAGSFAPTKAEFQTGASIVDSLLQGGIEKAKLDGDIAKALLGAAFEAPQTVDPNVNKIEAEKAQINMKLKMYELDKKMKEYERDSLKEKTPDDPKVKVLEAEIADLETKIQNQNLALTRAEVG